MKKKLIAIAVGLSIGILISLSANADLDKAVDYAEAGEIRKAEIELYKISQKAMDGNPKAMCEFGTMYMKEGYWIVQSDKDALEWWLKSAELGYAPCQFSVGSAYLIGKGVEKDLSKAKFWLYKAKEGTNEKYAKMSAQIYAIHALDNY
jgi:TPR repeat protein